MFPASASGLVLKKVAERKERFRVLVDMDCTICDFESHFLRQFQSKFPHLPYIPLSSRKTFFLMDQYCVFGDHMAVSFYFMLENI